MRLYLSSFRIGNRPAELLKLLQGRKRTAVILNAVDFKSVAERAQSFEHESNELRSLSLEPAELDLRSYFGNPAELKKVLSGFDLLWVRGGNAFILRRAFRQSGADEIIKELLEKDALVYGGYSAGVLMLTPSLTGADLVDDPNLVPPPYEPPIIWDCLGILPYALAPHYNSVHPESPAVNKMVAFLKEKSIPFKTLRDGEVIVRNGDKEIIWG